MHVEQLSLWQFRNYISAEFAPAAEGVTVLDGPNGAGKTNVLEAVAYLASLRSFRGAPTASLLRGEQPASLLALRAFRDGRLLQLEAEVVAQGRGRLKRNGQTVRRSEDFVGALLVTVLSPDDVGTVKGGPQARRELLDAAIVSLSPKYERTLSDLERALRQRNALLRAASGGLRPGMADLLDVWDAKLAEAGEEVAMAREALVHMLQPEVGHAYEDLGGLETVELCYEHSWEGGLLDALKDCRQSDLQRGVTGAGPQRDDLRLMLGGLPARSQASQGQQRSLALALRLGAHALVTAHQGTSPVLLLDDVFSELDPIRSAALASCLPRGQALLTTAGRIPSALPVAAAFEVSSGSLRPAERLSGRA